MVEGAGRGRGSVNTLMEFSLVREIERGGRERCIQAAKLSLLFQTLRGRENVLTHKERESGRDW